MRRVLVAIALSATLAGGFVLQSGCRSDDPSSETSEVWQCPMHPQVVRDGPGECPICGMRLVKVEMEPPSATPTPAGHEHGATGTPPADGASAASAVEGRSDLTIDSSRQQLIGLRTERVTRGEAGAAADVPGRVAVDPTQVRTVAPKVGGTVEQLLVDAPGRRVRAGELLFTLYSPDLLLAQEELLLAARTRDALGAAGDPSGGALVAAARRKLGLLDVPKTAIDALEQTGEPTRTLSFSSPVGGVVTAVTAREGAALAAGDVAFEVADLSTVWVVADLWSADVGAVSPGQHATFSADALPGRTFPGAIAVVEPVLDGATRTTRLHVHLANPDGSLVPGLYGRVVVEGTAVDALLVPADAVLPTGTRDIVFVALGEGRFSPREVTLGRASGGRVEVLAGLAEGEEVVTRASFLVDSESSVRAALAAIEK